MENIWGYRDTLTATGDITGFDVEAIDGSIGSIDEANNDAGSAWLVVDTGFWIFGRKRLIPAGVVDRIDDAERKVYVTMSKDQIQQAPDYDPDWSRDESSRSTYSDFYQPYGW